MKKRATILIVEDEAIIARDIKQQLEQLGYEVVGHTVMGEEAQGLAAELKPDLVLMDIHLAGAMDGIEAAQAVRKQLAIPVVFLTAFAGAETLERAKLVEPFGYIIKPFDERYLHTVIEMALFKHRAESHLRRAYDEQATILKTALDGFLMADWQGRLLDVNASSCQMLGYAREELLKMSLDDLQISTEAGGLRGIEGLKQPETARFEREMRRKDGAIVVVEVSVNYLPHSGGRIFCFARDITERKAAEAALHQLNEDLETRVADRTRDLEAAREEAESANRAKAAFLATMTHELRTPLNGVIGTLDAMRQTNLERDQTEMLDLMGESATSLLALVDDILDFSKIEAGRLGIDVRPMSVHEVVEKACTVLVPTAERAEVELTMFVDPNIPPSLLGDSVRLKQVLLNLANNAVKFSSRQTRPGKVSVRALLTARGDSAASVAFEVKDNGIGMDAETLSGLFKAFTQGDASITRRFGGTGLGLAICDSLVELMGGEITVESEVGRGSTFRFSMTFNEPALQVEALSCPPELAGLSCLVIGDATGLQGDLAAYLDAAGAAVDNVPNLEMAKRHASDRPTGLWVWIIDSPGGAPTLEALRAAASGRPETDTRFVVIGRGRRRKARTLLGGVVVIDANVLKRDTFLKAVASTAGRGDTAAVQVPLTLRRAPAPPPSRDVARERGQLILVAEDNEVNQKVILRQLSLLGYLADIAPGGLQALEMWRTGDYALLLADLHMPDMDGYQLTAAIRVQEGGAQHAVIIALTADVLKGGAQQCRDAGLDDYLCKPARLSELKAMLEKWMPAPAAAGATTQTPPAPEDEAQLGRPVDIAVLEELVGRDPDVTREFLRAFWISTAKTASELKAACQEKAFPLVADLAHKLKSPARSVGALRLADLCEELEEAARDQDAPALEKGEARFEREAARVQVYLREY